MIALLCGAMALAAPEAAPALDSHGELRAIGSLPPDPLIGPDGERLGQGAVLDSRVRAGLQWRPGRFQLALEVDALDGQVLGDTWDVPGEEDARRRDERDAASLDGVSLRRAALEGRIGPVGVQAGLVTSHWGLGMLANDGAHDPLFGRTDFGDRVLRLRLATRPLGDAGPLTLSLAGDRVVEDETATWGPLQGGPAAWQGIAALLWKQVGTVGVYTVYRVQVEEDRARRTEATVLDLYGDLPVALGDWSLRMSGELAIVGGQSSRSQSYNAREGLMIRSQGFTGALELRPKNPTSVAWLRVGWASGDGDPDDGVSRDFSFDRDFDAGMVLHDELMGAIDAFAYSQLNDPENAARPPDGAELLVGEGALRRAAFLQPAVGGNLWPWLHLRLGSTLHLATAPVAQPFETYRAGGRPTNQLGEPTEGYALGTELNGALHLLRADPEARLQPAFLLQAGHLLAARNLGGGGHTLVTATGRLRW